MGAFKQSENCLTKAGKYKSLVPLKLCWSSLAMRDEWQPSNRLECYTNDTTLAILCVGLYAAAGSVCRGKCSATYQLWNVKVSVVREWMSDLFDMSVPSQQGVVQTLRCVNTGQSNFVWLITVFNQVKFTSVHAAWKRNPTGLFYRHRLCQWWQGRSTYHLCPDTPITRETLDTQKITSMGFNDSGRRRCLVPLFF